MLTAQSALRKDRTTRATLEHRHFATIAAIIAAMPEDFERQRVAKQETARHFADELADTNPKFDRKRFLAACNV